MRPFIYWVVLAARQGGLSNIYSCKMQRYKASGDPRLRWDDPVDSDLIWRDRLVHNLQKISWEDDHKLIPNLMSKTDGRPPRHIIRLAPSIGHILCDQLGRMTETPFLSSSTRYTNPLPLAGLTWAILGFTRT